MASRKENLRALFTNTRTRVVIVFTIILLAITIIIGIIKLNQPEKGPKAKTNLEQVPQSIQSIPGAPNPTAQYAKLQQEQNISQAKLALDRGGSSIPTIIRSQALGEGVEVVGSQEGKGSVGFSTLARENESGAQKSLWLQNLKDNHCDKKSMDQAVNQGATVADLKTICTCIQLKGYGYRVKDLQEQCSCKELKVAGFTAKELKEAGLDAGQLKECGFNACQLKGVGFSAQEMKNGGFSDGELKGSGFAEADIAKTSGLPASLTESQVREAKCEEKALQRLRSQGVSAGAIRRINGCSISQLRNGGYGPEELKLAGLKGKELLLAGFTPESLRQAGYDAAEVDSALGGSKNPIDCSVLSLSAARKANVSAATIKQTLGCSVEAMRAAGFTEAELRNAGYPGLAQAIPSIAGTASTSDVGELANTKQLQAILNRQNQMQYQQVADQRYQQKIQQRVSQMLGVANQSLQDWQKVSLQIYAAGDDQTDKAGVQAGVITADHSTVVQTGTETIVTSTQQRALIKTGDVVFAVLDTAINSDEPGPILATIVSGRFKGAKLIGSFNLPNNADKMVVNFNAMSIPGAPKTIPINAYAIDPNTARTAIASKADHHYLLRYGSLFASSFLEGFGNAFQSANTTVTIGGTGGGDNITVQNGIGRSALENAVIGLATVGKSWGQVTQQQFSRPTTVEVCSGTPLGILFTQDVIAI